MNGIVKINLIFTTGVTIVSDAVKISIRIDNMVESFGTVILTKIVLCTYHFYLKQNNSTKK